MEREIKFRAYDIINKKWLFGYDHPNLGGFSLIGEVVLMGELNSIPLADWNNIDIMQFTGLKDKNGVDIYEGDIVKWGHLSGSYEDPIRIAVVSINPDISFTLIPSVDPRQHVFHYGTFIYKKTELALEVIGNIHESSPHNSI